MLQLLLVLGLGLADTSGVGPLRPVVRLEIAVGERQEAAEIFVETWEGGSVRITRRATPRGVVELPAAELEVAERVVIRSVGFRPVALRRERVSATGVVQVSLEACRLTLPEASGEGGVELVYHPKVPLCSRPGPSAIVQARSPAV